MPPHAGHLYACRVGCSFVDTLTVLVCSTDREPIPGHLRFQWMSEELAGANARVLHMHRDIPQEPSEHPDFWPIWQAAIREFHPEPIDWVFGSETYIKPLAAWLDARPYIVDLHRRTVPVSGTAIRADPQANWDYIPAAARPYFQRKALRPPPGLALTPRPTE